MFRTIVSLLTFFVLPASFDPEPDSIFCKRQQDEQGPWWVRSEQYPCEVLKESNEDCGVCITETWGHRQTQCFIIAISWKFNFLIHSINPRKQECIMNDHCEYSYSIKYKRKDNVNYVNLICGTEVNGNRVQRGDCKSVYGTYICDCKEGYRGRDCNDDRAPPGEYATGVQVLMEAQWRVSRMMTILIAMQTKGKDLKVHVQLPVFGVVVTITEPIIYDPSSKRLVKNCEINTELNNLCSKYLSESHYLYTFNIRFPKDGDGSVQHYVENVNDKAMNYKVGYYTSLTVTTTNRVNNEEKVSFYRTNYDDKYNIFVKYPVSIECYNVTKIANCAFLKEKVDGYEASTPISLYGIVTGSSTAEEDTGDNLMCKSLGNDAMKWKLSKVMPDGRFNVIDELTSEYASTFLIKPYSFTNGMYVVEFSHAMTSKWNDHRENFDMCFFTVVEKELIAIIDGGTSRYAAVDSVVTLDGSRSNDPNLKGDQGKVGLKFKWSCTMNERPCLGNMLTSQNVIKIPAFVLEERKEYSIKLTVTKDGKSPAVAYQTITTGIVSSIQSIEIVCKNCLDGYTANPTDYIYLSVQVVLKTGVTSDPPSKFTWTFSTLPDRPPDKSVDSIRVNGTSQDLLKIEKNALSRNSTYCFRAEVTGYQIYAEIDIRIPPEYELACSLSPDGGVVAVTRFNLTCSNNTRLTYEVYDKSSTDVNYFSGRMLFTGFENPNDNNFTLANGKVVVYGYNEFKVIKEWIHDVKLTPFQGNLSEIDEMASSLEEVKMYPQRLLHSSSVIPSALQPEMDWSSINLLKRLVSIIDVYQSKLEEVRYLKLVLSSLESILVVMYQNFPKRKLEMKIEEAKMCADITVGLANSLFEQIKEFDDKITLTDTILHGMIRSHLNVIEIVVRVREARVLSKPLYLVNPYTLYIVKDTTYELVDTLYKLSSCLLWRQIKGDFATEIVSNESNITQWVMVQTPDVLYRLRRQDETVPFNFSLGFYQVIKNVDVLGIQVTNLKSDPFWWAGGDINTNILLVDLCFKVNLTQCRYRRTFYKSPIFLYFNITQPYSSIKPLDMHTVYLNLSRDPYDLDLDITVYRFDPPLRAKLFIHFEFVNPTENYKVLFSINRRPGYEQINKKGVTVNNGNQSVAKYLKYIKDDSDKLYYMGIFPVEKGAAGEKAKFKLTMVYVVCKTWLSWKWGNERCWVGEQETDAKTLRCDCNHLSMFGGTVQVPPYTLNPGMEFLLFLTEEFNWLPLLMLLIALLVCVLLCVWGWRKDRKDLTKGVVMVLEDNYPGEKYGYLVGVYTGSRINSGTDANVGIKLFGENERSRAHILKSSSRRTLRGNSDDWFLLYSPANLGTLESIQLWHDNSGNSPDWFIEKIEVYDLTDKFEYIFELDIWLAFGVNEYPDAVVATSSIDEFYSVRRVFVSNVVTGFRDVNYWTSIFWKHARNPVKRVHRVSVVLSYILVAMICSILLYHFNKGEEYKEDEPSYELDLSDLIIFIITLVVASFFSCLFMFLFRKSFSHRYVRMQSSIFMRPDMASRRSTMFNLIQKRESISQIDSSLSLARLSTTSLFDSSKPRFIEISNDNKDERFIRFGLRSKRPKERSMYENFAAAVHAIVRGSTLEPVRLPKYRSNVTLHKKYFITVWILFVIVTLSAIAVVIVFGHQIPKVESEKWVTVFLCVLLFDALILSTLKIVLCSLILGCVFQRLVPASNYQFKPEEGMQKNLVGNLNHLYKLAQIRSQPMYCPLSENKKEIIRLKYIRREQWKTLIDFLVVLLLILVLVMLTFLFTVSLYRSNAHAAWMLTGGPSFKFQNFTSIYNRTHYTKFIFYNLLDQMHRYLWYNEKQLNEKNYQNVKRKSWAYDCTMRLLGNARIRQLRVVLGECSDVKYFEDMEDDCSPPWSSRVEDTGTYGSRWYVGGIEDLRRKSTAWRYTDADYSNSSVTYGVSLTKYPSGGFIGDLGFERDEAEGALSGLIPQNWFDHMTRAVFLELTLYNVNTRLFSQVVLIAEQMPTGEYLVAVKAESVSTDFSLDVWMCSYCVFLVFFLIRMCVLMNRRGIFVYFSHAINVFEGCLLALGFLTFIFYLVHIITSSDYVREFQRSGIDEFFSFYNLISYMFLTRAMLCVLFACAVVRMLISLRFGRIFFTFYYTFLLSTPWILWLVLCFTLCLAVFRWFLGYLLQTFVLTLFRSAIIYRMDSSISALEDLSDKALLAAMCLSSYVVILLFIASFTYYYKIARVFKLIATDQLNFYEFLKASLTCKNKKKVNENT